MPDILVVFIRSQTKEMNKLTRTSNQRKDVTNLPVLVHSRGFRTPHFKKNIPTNCMLSIDVKHHTGIHNNPF